MVDVSTDLKAFDWNITDISDEYLNVRLMFDNPNMISSQTDPDRVIIIFNDVSEVFVPIIPGL